MYSIQSKTLLVALLALGAAQAQATMPAPAFPNPGSYTQDYATLWFTEDVSATTKLFQYAVINLGTEAYQERTVDLGGDPQVLRTDWRRDSPYIKTYDVPIISAFAYGAIKQDTIQSPDGWSYRFIDTNANPGSWTNGTGDHRFDNPYRVMQWYVDDSKAQDGDLVSHMEYSGIRPEGGWLTRENLTEYVADAANNHLGYGGGGCGLTIWREACYGKGFSFEAVAGKSLGPDQTSWSLVTRMGSFDTVIHPLPPRLGDPDLPVGNHGLSFGGGIATIAAAPVPEPETFAMLLAGLGLVGVFARKRKPVQA